MKSRSVSITGASGFLGWHLCEAFRAGGWDVRAIVRQGSAKPVADGVHVHEAALSRTSLVPALKDTDVVVHCAALVRAPSEAVFHATNVEGTRAVVEAANETGARIVHVSSQAAAGPAPRERPASEDDQPRPLNAYGRSKLASEEIVAALARTPWTIVRPCAVYGPRDRGFLPLHRLARRGVFLLPAPAATPFTLVEVGDVARAIVLAATSEGAIGARLFVGHPEPRTIEDLLRTLADVYARPYRPRQLPRGIMRAAAWLGDAAWRLGRKPLVDSGRVAEFSAGGFVCSVERARQRLGFTAEVTLPEGIARTARWYEARGMV